MKEKELEDLICANPHCILASGGIILGRQIPLTHGRLDILAWDYGQTYVIELKVRPLQEKDVGQVLRYTNDVRRHLQVAFQQAIKQDQHFDLETWRGNVYADRLMPLADPTLGGVPAIQPMLVGPSATSSVLASAHGAGVEIKVWTANDESEIRFKPTGEHDSLNTALDFTPQWAIRITALAQELAWEQADHHIDYNITKLFKQVTE